MHLGLQDLYPKDPNANKTSTPLVDYAYAAVGSLVVAVVLVAGAGVSLLVAVSTVLLLAVLLWPLWWSPAPEFADSIVLRVVSAAGSIVLLLLSFVLSTVNLI